LIVVAAFKAPAVVAGLDDVTVMVSRSSSAVVILVSPNTLGHSPNARLVVTMTEVRS
jgi:hypothetical protein